MGKIILLIYSVGKERPCLHTAETQMQRPQQAMHYEHLSLLWPRAQTTLAVAFV